MDSCDNDGLKVFKLFVGNVPEASVPQVTTVIFMLQIEGLLSEAIQKKP